MKRKEIAFILTATVLLFSGLLYFGKDPLVGQLFFENRNAFLVFGIILLALMFITGILYERTLDFVDNETPATVRMLVVNIVLWCIFWICWSGYNAMVLVQYPVSFKVFLFSIMLATIPGLSFLAFAIHSRREDLASRSIKHAGSTPAEIAVYEKLLALPYYTGFYGILTVPVYGIVFVVLQLVKY